MTTTWELIEIDPATGEEDMLVATGSERRMRATMVQILCDTIEAGDEIAVRYRVQRVA